MKFTTSIFLCSGTQGYRKYVTAPHRHSTNAHSSDAQKPKRQTKEVYSTGSWWAKAAREGFEAGEP